MNGLIALYLILFGVVKSIVIVVVVHQVCKECVLFSVPLSKICLYQAGPNLWHLVNLLYIYRKFLFSVYASTQIAFAVKVNANGKNLILYFWTFNKDFDLLLVLLVCKSHIGYNNLCKRIVFNLFCLD